MIERLYLFINNYKRWFIWAAVIAVLSVFGLPLIKSLVDSRVKYDWDNKENDYGNKECTSPYGSKYYIEHLQSTWKGGVECDSDLQESLAKHQGQKCNYIYFGRKQYFLEYSGYEDEDSSVMKDFLDYSKKLIDAVGSGNNILFCNCSTDENHAMLFECKFHAEFYVSDFKSNSYTKVSKQSMYFIDPKTEAHLDSAMIWDKMLYNYFDTECTLTTFNNSILQCYRPYGYGRVDAILESYDLNYYAVARHFGKGCALSNGVPFLFSNYAMSVPDVQRVSDKLVHYAFDENLPLVIIYTSKVEDSYDDEGDYRPNMFKVMFNNPATKVAMYLLVIMLLLVVLVNGRRRVRALHVKKREENSSLSYVSHLATLYSDSSDYKELLEIEQRKILYQLRKEYRFDISTNSFTKPSEYAAFIARNKGGNEDNILMALNTLESLTLGAGQVSYKDYIACLKLLATHFYDNK